jgi:GT2 family glycosyltransferase
MKDLSIIIVTYNSEGFIGECLDSLFKNIFGLDFEVIIVDNNSIDGTVNLIRKNFGDKTNLKIIENKENIGFARGINEGIKISDGKKMLFLNPDTLIPVGSIEKLIKFLDERSNIGIIGCRTEDRAGRVKPSFGCFPRLWQEISLIFGFRKILGHVVYPNFLNRKKFFQNREVDWISGACFIVRQEVVAKIGLLDERFFMYFEDIDFCKRAKEVGYKTFYLGEIMVYHELGRSEERLFKKDLYGTESLLAYFGKYYPRQVFVLKILIAIRRILLRIKSIFV